MGLLINFKNQHVAH